MIQNNSIYIDISDLIRKDVGEYISGDLQFDYKKYMDIPVISPMYLKYKVIKDKKSYLLYLNDINVKIKSICVRCLSDIIVDINIKEAVAVFNTLKNDDEFYIIKNKIYLDDVIYQELILYGIDQCICNDNCKGICQYCYVNLNNMQCKCNVN